MASVSITDLKKSETKWPSIARDIALLATPVDGATTYTASDIAAEYGLPLEHLTALLALPAFQELVRQELAHIKTLGPKAGARLRAEAMAIEVQEYLFNRVTRLHDLDDKLSVQFYGMLLKSAGLEQPPEMAQAQAPQNTVNIAFNIPKLKNPKLAHLASLSQTRVIDAGGSSDER